MNPRTRPTRRYHLHWPGVSALALTVILGIGAVNSQNNLLFLVLGVALSSILASGIVSGSMLMGIRATRTPPPVVHAGSTDEIEYTVASTSRFMPAFALLVEEIEDHDRRHARRRSRRARRRKDPTTVPVLPGAVACVRAGRSVRVRAIVRPTQRGVIPLTGIEVSSSFPLGVFRKSVRFDTRSELVVAPAVRTITSLELSTVLAGRRGEGRSRSRAGSGLDFFGLRDYVPGDSPKRVAWKAWARTDQVVVRQTADEPSRTLGVVLAIDPADSIDACEHAISECASIALAADRAGVPMEVTIAGRRARMPVVGRRSVVDLLDALARLDVHAPFDGRIDAGGAAHLIVASGPRGRTRAPAGRVWSVRP